ncbi:hypothetical protein [Marinobacterium sp. xm-d-564]|uniref:hypothetical protein n=1 Tax=Marinobacterium sp. xm-d-564 TaxID=2497742 RepID=UPI0015685A26|nr:hypothetical protein [Marinobacterium sp. xm-d-564]NRP58437.1 hypothetical protein [Marinobacterium sp. xm-d-564]
MGCGIVEKKFGSTQIDTLALFQIGGNRVLNTNDCPFELASHTIMANHLHELNIDLLLVGYAGAGPYPQCFEFDTEEEKLIAANGKEQQFINQAIKYIELIKPTSFAPFAGTYMLGSRLSSLTKFRGVPSVLDATTYLNNAVSSISNGIYLERFDTYDCEAQSLKKSEDKFALTRDEYVSEISKRPLDYDNDYWDDGELGDLIAAAYKRFMAKAEEINFISKTNLVIRSDKFAFQLNTNGQAEEIEVTKDLSEPFVRIDVDHNLLHRLLRGPRFAHWNNAEIGSHLKYLRKPNTFERGLYHCLCFLHA